MYLSTTPFPISTRNSPAAVANLASKTGLATMFVSADDAMQRLAAEANDILRPHGRQFDILPMPLFDRLYSPGNDENTVQIGPVRPDKASIVLHSSGMCVSFSITTKAQRLTKLCCTQAPPRFQNPLSSLIVHSGNGALTHVSGHYYTIFPKRCSIVYRLRRSGHVRDTPWNTSRADVPYVSH